MILMAIAVVLFLICFASVTERVQQVNKKVYSYKEIYKIIGTNIPLILISVSYIFYSINFTLRLSSVIYYAKYNLGNESLSSIILVVATAAGLIGTGVSLLLTRKFGKSKTYLMGMAVGAISFIIIYFIPYSNITFLIIMLSINSIGLATPLAATWAMAPDAVEYGEWKTGKRAEGATFGVFSFVQKLAGAIAGAISGFILAVIGYVPNAAQTSQTLDGIRHMFITVPFICCIICIIIISFYKLDENRVKEMLKEISGKKAAE